MDKLDTVWTLDKPEEKRLAEMLFNWFENNRQVAIVVKVSGKFREISKK